eukprot:4631927-Amphidinium_carterae.8
MVLDHEFWQLEKPSLTICAKGASTSSLLDGDAPTTLNHKSRARPSDQADQADQGASKRQRHSGQQFEGRLSQPGSGRLSQPEPRVYKTNDKGEFTHNRKGLPLCGESDIARQLSRAQP